MTPEEKLAAIEALLKTPYFREGVEDPHRVTPMAKFVKAEDVRKILDMESPQSESLGGDGGLDTWNF